MPPTCGCLLPHPPSDTNNRSIISARGLPLAYFGRSLFIWLHTTLFTIQGVAYQMGWIRICKASHQRGSPFRGRVGGSFSSPYKVYLIRSARLWYVKVAINRIPCCALMDDALFALRVVPYWIGRTGIRRSGYQRDSPFCGCVGGPFSASTMYILSGLRD